MKATTENIEIIEKKIDDLIFSMKNPSELEDWASEHGNQIDLSEYREFDSDYDDSIPDDIEIPNYADVQDDGRVASIGTIDDHGFLHIRVSAINHGNCGNNFAARIYDIDVDELWD